LIRRLREEGRTIVISTHYIEEAEKYCDEVAVLHKGKLFVVDTPDGLVRKYGTGDKLEIILTKPVSCEKLSSIAGVLGVQELHSSTDAATYILSGQHGEYMLEQTVLGLIDSNVQLREARIIRSGLEGAYLHLTGERIPS
jgi:ABC-2 type transport system ATP-binding protein